MYIVLFLLLLPSYQLNPWCVPAHSNTSQTWFWAIIPRPSTDPSTPCLSFVCLAGFSVSMNVLPNPPNFRIVYDVVTAGIFVCCHPTYPYRQVRGCTRQCHIWGRPHIISSLLVYCACLNFSRETDSAVSFLPRLWSRTWCTDGLIFLHLLDSFSRRFFERGNSNSSNDAVVLRLPKRPPGRPASPGTRSSICGTRYTLHPKRKIYISVDFRNKSFKRLRTRVSFSVTGPTQGHQQRRWGKPDSPIELLVRCLSSVSLACCVVVVVFPQDLFPLGYGWVRVRSLPGPKDRTPDGPYSTTTSRPVALHRNDIWKYPMGAPIA